MMMDLYAANLLLASKTKSQKLWTKQILSERFKIKDLGEAKVTLGLEIIPARQKRELWLTQQAYMAKTVDRFGMSVSKAMSTPMEEPKFSTDRIEVVSEKDETANGVPYCKAIGKLMYLMIGGQPDIAYEVRKRARFWEISKWKQWVPLKRVLRQVNETSNMGLCYNGLKTGKLAEQDYLTKQDMFGYADSDWARDVSDRKLTSSNVFMMSGSAVAWCPEKQTVVSISSCEVKYVAISMA